MILLWTGCSSDSLPAAEPSNPLAECPDSPNCERLSAQYDHPPERLFEEAAQALEALGPATLRLQPDSLRGSAVYRVAWVFKDDVDIAVESQPQGSLLHARSASRTGYEDLGVNCRRMQRFLAAVDDGLSDQASAP